LMASPDVMMYVFRCSKQRRRYQDFATIRGHPMPVRVVAMEGWRRYYSQPAIVQQYVGNGMNIYRGRWSEDRIDAYLKNGPCRVTGFSSLHTGREG
jgi:hypothetical protein